MATYLWLLPTALVLAYFAYRGASCWGDAGRRGFGPLQRLCWGLVGAIVPTRHWWEERIEALSPGEQLMLLATETASLGLERADGLPCPLCQAEVPGAWRLDTPEKPLVAEGPIACPECDYRLDACRHCTHFLPSAAPQPSGLVAWKGDEIAFGRCSHYREWQPVEQTTTSEMARQLRARGWERIRGPAPILDSYIPLEHCTAFRPEWKRLRASGVPWPDTRRRALLRILRPRRTGANAPGTELESGDDMWLL